MHGISTSNAWDFHVEYMMVGGYAVAEVTVRGLISILFHRPH